MSVPFVRAVVLNWNGGDHVVGAVEALLRTKWPVSRFRVVVVDNASTDGSDAEIERRFPVVDLRRSATNRGFPANNDALGDLDGIDYVALVNNDAFVEPDWLAPLVAAFDDKPTSGRRLGAACPKIVFAPRFGAVQIECADGQVAVAGVSVDGVDRWRYSWFGPGFAPPTVGRDVADAERTMAGSGAATLGLPWMAGEASSRATILMRSATSGGADVTIRSPHGESTAIRLVAGETAVEVPVAMPPPTFDVIQNAGSMLLEGFHGADRGFGQRDEGQLDTPVEVFAWCGGAVLLASDYLRAVGLFEERYFMYYEDTDLAWRGRAEGWCYRYVPTSSVRHLHATSSREGSDLFRHHVERNRLMLLIRNASTRDAAAAVLRYALTTASAIRRDLRRAVEQRRPPRWDDSRVRIRVLIDLVRLGPVLLPQRWRLGKRATVSPSELTQWIRPRHEHPL